MKKFFFATIIILFATISVSAESGKVSTSINLKNDWMFPESGESFEVQRLSTYWHYNNFGGGLDLSYKRKADYIQFNPYLTLSRGKWSLVGGGSFDNFSKYADAGLWFADAIGKVNIFYDIRNFFAIDGKAKGYMENFLDLIYPISDRFYIGADFDYVHWWEDEHDYFFAGPILGYKINKSVSTCIRFTHEWDILENKTSESNRVRWGLILKF